jgi:Na+-driven multidrug efflux pump
LVLAEALAGICLTVATVVVHVAGLFLLIRYVRRLRARYGRELRPILLTRVLLIVTLWFVALHLFEVAMWAALYFYVRGFDNARHAFYFSLGSYTTVGSGELALPPQWEMLTGIEAIVGVLMVGLSTAFIVAVLRAMDESRPAASAER